MQEVDLLLRRKDGATLCQCELYYPRVRVALDSHMKSVSKYISIVEKNAYHFKLTLNNLNNLNLSVILNNLSKLIKKFHKLINNNNK